MLSFETFMRGELCSWEFTYSGGVTFHLCIKIGGALQFIVYLMHVTFTLAVLCVHWIVIMLLNIIFSVCVLPSSKRRRLLVFSCLNKSISSISYDVKHRIICQLNTFNMCVI